MSTHNEPLDVSAAPDTTVDAASLFGIKTGMKVPAFKKGGERHSPNAKSWTDRVKDLFK